MMPIDIRDNLDFLDTYKSWLSWDAYLEFLNSCDLDECQWKRDFAKLDYLDYLDSF